MHGVLQYCPVNKIMSNKKAWLKKKIIPILVVLLAVAITVVLFLYRDKVVALGNYGYLGAFLVCLISNTSIILPVPGIVVLFALGTTLNPVLVALAGATGGVIGEITGFMAGYGGRGMVQGGGRIYTLAEDWMKRWGGWAIFVFAVFPIPILDIAGVVAGILRYPLWKFLLIAWPGKSLKYIILVLAGAYGWQAVLRFLG
jgi:membrane protein YqaA with SNARE-associated domain